MNAVLLDSVLNTPVLEIPDDVVLKSTVLTFIMSRNCCHNTEKLVGGIAVCLVDSLVEAEFEVNSLVKAGFDVDSGSKG